MRAQGRPAAAEAASTAGQAVGSWRLRLAGHEAAEGRRNPAEHASSSMGQAYQALSCWPGVQPAGHALPMQQAGNRKRRNSGKRGREGPAAERGDSPRSTTYLPSGLTLTSTLFLPISCRAARRGGGPEARRTGPAVTKHGRHWKMTGAGSDGMGCWVQHAGAGAWACRAALVAPLGATTEWRDLGLARDGRSLTRRAPNRESCAAPGPCPAAHLDDLAHVAARLLQQLQLLSEQPHCKARTCGPT